MGCFQNDVVGRGDWSLHAKRMRIFACLRYAVEFHNIARKAGYHSRALRTDLERLDKVYSSKALKYFSILYLITTPTLPELSRLFRFASGLNRYMVDLIREPA